MSATVDTPKKKYLNRLAHLKLERNSWDDHYNEIALYISPRGYRKTTQDRNSGTKINNDIIDNTPVIALRTLASGMLAGLTSPARPWFRLATNDNATMESATVKEWLATVERSMREVFVRSNLYQTLPMAYSALGAFGTAALLELEDEEDVVRFYPLATGSYYLAASHRQNIDTIYREFSMTVGQIVAEFGYNNCSDTVKNAYDQKNIDTWIDILHAIEPNLDREDGKIDSKPFLSMYCEIGADDGKFLRQTGFEEFPAMCPRWATTGEDIYGHSPSMDCLGDVKALQLETKRKIQAIDKMVNPPMLGDAMLRNQRTSLVAGDITYISGLAQSQHAGFRPAYEVNPRIQELSQDIMETQQRIKRCLYEDMMLMFAISDNSQMTAREVEERHSEKLLVLGAVMERLNEELLDPIIDRTFAIMMRKGMIPPAPEELQGEALRIEYISIMAQAQKLVDTAGIERMASFIGNLAGVRPDALDKLNVDGTIDAYADRLGVPPEMIVSNDQVQAARIARAEQQQMQAQAEAMPAIESGANAAKLLSETGVGESTALNRLLGI